MKKLVASALVAASVFAATPASAAEYLVVAAPTGGFGNIGVTCTSPAPLPCSFTNVFQFLTPIGYKLISLDITSIANPNNSSTNIDFTQGSVTFNGAAFTMDQTGVTEHGFLNNAILNDIPQLNTLSVSGVAYGNGTASYQGTLAFAAVPEPSTWAMLIAGIGAIGLFLRRRKTAVKGAFA